MSFKWLFLYLFLAIIIVILGWYGETYLNENETLKSQESSLNNNEKIIIDNSNNKHYVIYFQDETQGIKNIRRRYEEDTDTICKSFRES